MDSEPDNPPSKDGNPLEPWVDPALEARIVALVLGEASAFERAELERAMREQPELAVFHRRMRAVHGLLADAHRLDSPDIPAMPGAGGSPWGLSPERRARVLAAIRGGADAGDNATEADESPAATAAPSPGAPGTGRSRPLPIRQAVLAISAIAATIAILLIASPRITPFGPIKTDGVDASLVETADEWTGMKSLTKIADEDGLRAFRESEPATPAASDGFAWRAPRDGDNRYGESTLTAQNSRTETLFGTAIANESRLDPLEQRVTTLDAGLAESEKRAFFATGGAIISDTNGSGAVPGVAGRPDVALSEPAGRAEGPSGPTAAGVPPASNGRLGGEATAPAEPPPAVRFRARGSLEAIELARSKDAGGAGIPSSSTAAPVPGGEPAVIDRLAEAKQEEATPASGGTPAQQAAEGIESDGRSGSARRPSDSLATQSDDALQLGTRSWFGREITRADRLEDLQDRPTEPGQAVAGKPIDPTLGYALQDDVVETAREESAPVVGESLASAVSGPEPAGVSTGPVAEAAPELPALADVPVPGALFDGQDGEQTVAGGGAGGGLAPAEGESAGGTARDTRELLTQVMPAPDANAPATFADYAEFEGFVPYDSGSTAGQPSTLDFAHFDVPTTGPAPATAPAASPTPEFGFGNQATDLFFDPGASRTWEMRKSQTAAVDDPSKQPPVDAFYKNRLADAIDGDALITRLNTKADDFEVEAEVAELEVLAKAEGKDAGIAADSPEDEAKKKDNATKEAEIAVREQIAETSAIDTSANAADTKLSLAALVEAEEDRRRQTAVETVTADEPFSTFSLHVSDVAFKLAQAALVGESRWPETDKVRIEEFVNAFDYGDPAPTVDEKVGCRIDQAIHPFLQERNLLRISMRTAATGRSSVQPLVLTVLLDRSGSMEREDREASVLRAMEALARHLGPGDTVTLVAFAREPRLVADRLPGSRASELVRMVAETPSEGGTNLEEALRTAGNLARRQFLGDGMNRIVLLTDGAANLGNARPETLAEMVVALRQQGIAFDACGVGADGLNDAVLEALTRQGDGRYYFLDRPDDADEGFARQLAGALRPAARNVKIQVKFNPDRVVRHRLAGFDQHRLETEDFRNDAVDAAELAAEEAGVAVYQIAVDAGGSGEVGEVSVRFQDTATGRMVERTWTIPYEESPPRLERAEPAMLLAGTAALFAERLRDGQASPVDLDELAGLGTRLRQEFPSDPRVAALSIMIGTARNLTK